MSANSSQGSSSGQSTGYVDESIYIYQIPHSQFKYVCSCLDCADIEWEDVAREMKFDEANIIVS